MPNLFLNPIDYTALLAQGVTIWNKWRLQPYNAWFSEGEGSDCSLRNLNLRGINLQGASLGGLAISRFGLNRGHKQFWRT